MSPLIWRAFLNLMHLLMLSRVDDFNALIICLTAYLLKQCYRYHKLSKTFSKSDRR